MELCCPGGEFPASAAWGGSLGAAEVISLLYSVPQPCWSVLRGEGRSELLTLAARGWTVLLVGLQVM